MIKVLTIVLLMALFKQQIVGQTNSSNYSAYINLATSPSVFGFNKRFYKFSSDTLLIMNRINEKKINDSTYINIYDTTYYKITNEERQNIINTIKSIDTLESIFNFCMIDGLRFYFSCKNNFIEHSAWVSNAYDSRVFLFVDIINLHAPKDFQIRYNKDWLISENKKCLEEIFGAKN